MLTMPDDTEIPFYYCHNCSKLAPGSGVPTDHLICLACGVSMDLSVIGRKVLLSENEAILRSLIWRTN